MVQPTAGAARVVWETSSSAPSWISVDSKTYDGGWAVHHEVPITGLPPDGEHRIYVQSAEANALPATCSSTMVDNLQIRRGPQSTIASDPIDQIIQRRNLCAQLAAAIGSSPSVLRSAGSKGTVRLVVIGDTLVDTNASGKVFAAAKLEAPDLIVHTGDLVSEADEPNWQALFDHAQPLLSHAPIAPVFGEHDLSFGSDRFGQLFSVRQQAYLGHAYSVDEGPVHVAVLDSGVDLKASVAWLEQNLSDAETAGARHLFVALHWGPWSAGPQGGNGTAQEAIVPVARRHHVDAILSGHDNIYEHGVVDGLHYFVTGGGGNTSDPTRPIASTLKTASAVHYLVIDVTGATTHVLAKEVTGKVLDDVTLQNQ
jgi:hypothetical protein